MYAPLYHTERNIWKNLTYCQGWCNIPYNLALDKGAYLETYTERFVQYLACIGQVYYCRDLEVLDLNLIHNIEPS